MTNEDRSNNVLEELSTSDPIHQMASWEGIQSDEKKNSEWEKQILSRFSVVFQWIYRIEKEKMAAILYPLDPCRPLHIVVLVKRKARLKLLI